MQVKKPYSPVIVRDHYHVIVQDGHHQHHIAVNASMYPVHIIVLVITLSSKPSFINVGLKMPSDI